MSADDDYLDLTNAPGCTCPYFAGDDDECPLHGEKARHEQWMAK